MRRTCILAVGAVLALCASTGIAAERAARSDLLRRADDSTARRAEGAAPAPALQKELPGRTSHAGPAYATVDGQAVFERLPLPRRTAPADPAELGIEARPHAEPIELERARRDRRELLRELEPGLMPHVEIIPVPTELRNP